MFSSTSRARRCSRGSSRRTVVAPARARRCVSSNRRIGTKILRRARSSAWGRTPTDWAGPASWPSWRRCRSRATPPSRAAGGVGRRAAVADLERSRCPALTSRITRLRPPVSAPPGDRLGVRGSRTRGGGNAVAGWSPPHQWSWGPSRRHPRDRRGDAGAGRRFGHCTRTGVDPRHAEGGRRSSPARRPAGAIRASRSRGDRGETADVAVRRQE